ncbi:hypothetical protein [Larsenimonas rhizosphaerae]|uniref:hypothetical protein n=1 Tax=Larsenimonas rhizosphaerae TaxID=2944682 RepID=UPI002033A844|nr:hypothetical protein [Larsenimonas rhizosphaerae]MCM2131858.1 hypothetical protein [Larsenimonas rhizosphaerae]
MLVFITLVLAWVPFFPGMPVVGLDPSWALGMNQAVAQSLVFGQNIVFTYGPYASIKTHLYHPVTDGLMLGGSLYFTLMLFLALYVNLKKRAITGGVIMLLLFAGCFYSSDGMMFFYTLLAGLSVREVAGERALGDRARQVHYLLVASLFTAFGLLPLVKGSYLIGCLAVSLLSFIFCALKRDFLLAGIVLVLPVLAMVIFWTIAGQPLSALPDYFQAMLPIITGYTEAMSQPGNIIEPVTYILAGIAVVLFAALEAKRTWCERSFAALLFALILFLAFKAGFVRHDAHATTAACVLLLCAGWIAATSLSKRIWCVAVLVFLAGAYIASHYGASPFQIYKRQAHDNYIKAVKGLAYRFSDPDFFNERYDEKINDLKEMAGFPQLAGTTDIYSFDQAELIASGNHWAPRPVLQSYSAYTPELLALNRNYLLGDDAPDNILFRIQPIDSRLPSLADGASWPVLLTRYAPVSFDNNTLLLNKKSAPFDSRLVEVGSAEVKLGQPIPVPEDALFATVDVSKTWKGRLANTFFKSSEVDIRLNKIDGSVKNYRFIPGMGKTPFLISQDIENTLDFGLLYTGMRLSESHKGVTSFSIMPKQHVSFWKPDVTVHFFSLKVPTDKSLITVYAFSEPEVRTLSDVANIKACEGGMDDIDGKQPENFSSIDSDLLGATGWLTVSSSKGQLADDIYITLTPENGQMLLLATKPMRRPDVGLHFSNPLLAQAGFRLAGRIDHLHGHYTLGLAYRYQGNLVTCSQYNIPVDLNSNG